jgi:hypothetical protein
MWLSLLGFLLELHDTLQALQGFPDISQASIHEDSKINLPILQQYLPRAGKWQLHSTLSEDALYYCDIFIVKYINVLTKI